MKPISILLIALLFTPYCFAYPSYSGHMMHRSIIYFAPTHDQWVDKFIKDALIHTCELKFRDVVTLVITSDGGAFPKWVEEEFNLTAMYKIYQIPQNEHTGVLIGKDGQEKLRTGKVIDWNQMKSTIDKMPMRQNEVLNRINPCSA